MGDSIPHAPKLFPAGSQRGLFFMTDVREKGYVRHLFPRGYALLRNSLTGKFGFELT